MTTLASYRNPQPSQPLTLIDHVDRVMHASSLPQPVKFDAEFLERKMREFRERQQQQEQELVRGIICEVLAIEEAL